MATETLQFREYIHGDNEIRMMKARVDHQRSPHSHDFIEIAYIDAGKGFQTVNGKRERIQAGDLFLFNAHNIIHSFEAAEGTPLLVYNCLFQPLSVSNTFQECSDFVDVAYQYLFQTMRSDYGPRDYIKLSDLKFSETEQILYEMDWEFTREESGYMQVLKADLMRLLIQIFRLYRRMAGRQQDLSMYHRLIVRNAVVRLQEHYAEDIRCEWLAKQAYLSVNHFRKIFRDITGMTVIQMLQHIRIRMACQLLETTRFSVAEIADQVGYSDVKYFYQIFEKEKEMTPGEYRRLHR